MWYQMDTTFYLLRFSSTNTEVPVPVNEFLIIHLVKESTYIAKLNSTGLYSYLMPYI